MDGSFWGESIDEAIEMVAAENPTMVSGGRTRDWMFAGAIARKLGLPFLAMYKFGDMKEPEIITPQGDVTYYPDDLPADVGENVYHVADLTTDMGSIIKPEFGWLAQAANKKADIYNVLVFINRNPTNADTLLTNHGVNLEAMTTIDGGWFANHCEAAEAMRNIEFVNKGALAWTESYLRILENPEVLSRYFAKDPSDVTVGKDTRHLQFLDAHKDLLQETGLFQEVLDDATKKLFFRGAEAYDSGRPDPLLRQEQTWVYNRLTGD